MQEVFMGVSHNVKLLIVINASHHSVLLSSSTEVLSPQVHQNQEITVTGVYLCNVSKVDLRR